jgi:hypothetical protein
MDRCSRCNVILYHFNSFDNYANNIWNVSHLPGLGIRYIVHVHNHPLERVG